MNDTRALYVFLALRYDTQERDVAAVDALWSDNLSWFTHVFLNTTSWQESPLAVENPLVKHAVDLCREQGVGVVWGRWLWVGWSDDPQRFAHVHDDPAFYVNAIATVRGEARQLGASGTLLDVEPYGNSPQKKTLKPRDLGQVDRDIIEGRVAAATSVAGQVDYIFPTASTRSKSYVWPLTGLGVNRCCNKTYYSVPPDYTVNANPPPTHKHLIHLWGSAVATSTPAASAGVTSLTPARVKAIDLAEVRKLHPGCVGQWIYVDPEELPAVLDAWGTA